MTDRDDAVPTGPRTDAADPSRNATTHGLTAKRPLCEQEADRMRILIDTWAARHHPETEAEEALVQTAAIEYVRYLRCVQAEERQLGPNAREALADWQEKRRHAIRRKAQELRDDPARVSAELHESAFGIDWLVRHWRTLLGYLESGRGWLADDVATAMHLMGRTSQPPPASDIDGRRLFGDAALACPMAFDFRAARGIVDAEAATRLREFVADRIERLEAIRPLVWEDVEGPQAEAIEAAAMVDTSKEGQLRQRYRREALRDMQRGIGMLMRMKVERSKMEGRQLRQEQMARSSSSSSGDDRPAWVAAREASQRDAAPVVEPAAPATEPEPLPQRNGTAGAEPASAADRRNPNDIREEGDNRVGRSPEPAGRTGAHPGAHPGAPGRPIGGGTGPDRPGQGNPSRPPTPRRGA